MGLREELERGVARGALYKDFCGDQGLATQAPVKSCAGDQAGQGKILRMFHV